MRRLHSQPGVILADEVGMGKTFVDLAVARRTSRGRPWHSATLTGANEPLCNPSRGKHVAATTTA